MRTSLQALQTTFLRATKHRLHVVLARKIHQKCPGCGQVTDVAEFKSRTGTTHRPIQTQLQSVYEAAYASANPSLQASLGLISGHDVKKNSRSENQAPVCQRCHLLVHHSTVPSEEASACSAEADALGLPEHDLKELMRDPRPTLVQVIDVLDFPLGTKNTKKIINQVGASQVLNVYNRIDILTRTPRAAHKVNERLKALSDSPLDVYATSALKGWGIEALVRRLHRHTGQGSIFFLGTANAGKSSLLNAILRRTGANTRGPIASFVPGTTRGALKLSIAQNKHIYDLPGLTANGLWSFIEPECLRAHLPHKLISPKPISVAPGEGLLIGGMVYLRYLKGHEHILVAPYVQTSVQRIGRLGNVVKQAERSKVPPILRSTTPRPAVSHKQNFRHVSSEFNTADIVLKDLGFLSIKIWRGEATIEISSPGGLHTGVREPSIMANTYRD